METDDEDIYTVIQKKWQSIFDHNFGQSKPISVIYLSF